MASTASLWHLVLIVLAILNVKQTFCAPQVPCYFSFGDSIVDNGNNNDLLTTAKANYPPYGVDFPKGATGRFTNGRNLADFIAQLLGFTDFIPPFATAIRDQDILRGVNYGSGTAGIRDETGFLAGERFSVNQQLLNHATTVLRMAFSCRNLASLRKHLSKCLYTVVIGSNDYLNNYFSPGYPTSTIYTPDQYAAALIRQYYKQLEVLHKLGARKVALFGLGGLGCIPALRNAGGRNSCVDSINAAVELFNNRLRPLVDDLNQSLPNAKFIYLNASSIQSGDPRALGIQVLDKPCCRVSSTTGLCIRNSVPCSNRTQYAFYDAVHPTSVVYKYFAKRAYNSVLSSDAYPMDISHLVRRH